MRTISAVLRQLASRPAPPPAPSIGQHIQEREQQAAKTRLLDLAQQRAAQHLYDGPSR